MYMQTCIYMDAHALRVACSTHSQGMGMFLVLSGGAWGDMRRREYSDRRGSAKGLVKFLVSNWRMFVSLEPQVACLPDRARCIHEPAPAPTPALSTGSVGHPQAHQSPPATCRKLHTAPQRNEQEDLDKIPCAEPVLAQNRGRFLPSRHPSNAFPNRALPNVCFLRRQTTRVVPHNFHIVLRDLKTVFDSPSSSQFGQRFQGASRTGQSPSPEPSESPLEPADWLPGKAILSGTAHFDWDGLVFGCGLALGSDDQRFAPFKDQRPIPKGHG